MVADITDPQKKNLMATALKFVADNAPKKKPIKEGIKDLFKDPMQAADARGWIRNPKLSDTEKRDKIKSVMKDPSKFNDLMDAFTDELKNFKKPIKESVKDQIKRAVEEVIREKKLTKAELKKKEDIVKALKGTTDLPEPAMYAIATAKAKKLAENIILQKVLNKIK
jgi:hypothetical protein